MKMGEGMGDDRIETAQVSLPRHGFKMLFHRIEILEPGRCGQFHHMGQEARRGPFLEKDLAVAIPDDEDFAITRWLNRFEGFQGEDRVAALVIALTGLLQRALGTQWVFGFANGGP